MPPQGSNDLNLILKAKVVKLKVELDYKNSKLPSQVDSITKFLEKKPVKLKVELQASAKDLSSQIGKISTTLQNSKSFKPMKIAVEIDAQGSMVKIKDQLKEINKVMNDFAKEYVKVQSQINKINQQNQKQQTGNTNVPTNATVQNFNNIKNYLKQIEQAEAQMRSKFTDGAGIFGSTQLKDTQGNLRGFIATLQRANGVVEKVRYDWNKDKNQFQVIDRQTLTATQQNSYKATQILVDLERELSKTGKQATAFKREYQAMLRESASNTLTVDSVKGFQTRIKNAQQEVRVEQELINLNRERAKVLRDIKNATKGAGTAFTTQQTSLISQANKANDMNAIKDVRLALADLTDKVKNYKTQQKEADAIDKQRQTALKQLTKLMRETSESTGALEQANIRAVRRYAQSATSMKEMMYVQKQLNNMQKQQAGIKDITARENALAKLKKTMQEFAKVAGYSGDTIEAKFKMLQTSVGGNLAQIQKEVAYYQKKIQAQNDKIVQQQLNWAKGSIVKGVSGATMKGLVAEGDVAKIKEYLANVLKLDVATAKLATDSKGVTRITTTLASTGKTAKQVTYEVDQLNGKLRVMGTQDVFNRNANLGFLDQMKIALERVPVWMASMTAFYGSINGFKAMASEILNVDKALTELKRVASSKLNIDTIFQGAIDLSKELGNNVHDIMNAINDLSRTYGDFNERQLLAVAKTATLMSNVSDLGADDALKTLVGTMNAFNIVAEDSLHIVDALNQVDNDYAISTQQLAEGLQKSSSTAKTFGATLEENIGNITAIGAVTMESGAIIGNALKTIYSRITTIDDAKTALEGVGIALYQVGENGEKQIKPVQKILSDLAGKWGGLNEETKQNIAVTVAGRYQLSRFLALMNNWQLSTKATRTALSSQGSAMRENQKLMDSYGARINQLKNSFTEMSLAMGKAFMNSAMLGIIEGLKSIAQAVTTVVSTVGALPVIMGVFGVIALQMGAFTGAGNSTRAMLSLMKSEFLLASGGARTFGATLKGTIASLKATQVLLPSVARGIALIKVAMRELLASTVVGAVFVAIGYGLEKLLAMFENNKRIAEKTEKANKALADSYRTVEGGLDNLVKKQADLQFKVDSGAIKEGTDAYNDYVAVTNKLAEKMPTVVKYVDQSGLAHLKETNYIKEQVKIAKQLSDLENTKTKENYTKSLTKQLEKYDEQVQKIKDLNKQLKQQKALEKENEKIYTDEGVIDTGRKNDTTEQQQQTRMEIIQAEQAKQNAIQKTMILVQNTTMAYLDSDKKLKNLTDAGKTTIESMVQVNEQLLRYHKENGKWVENSDKQIEDSANKMLKLGQDLGTFMSDAYKSATKGIDSTSQDFEDAQKAVDNLVKALPDTFFKLDTLNNVDDLKERFQGVLSVADEVKNNTGDFSSLTTELQKNGFTADEAKSYVAQLSLEYKNATIRSQAMAQAESEGTDTLKDWVDTAIKAIDLSDQLFNINDDDVSAMKSHIENLQQLTLAFGKNAENMDSYKESIQSLSLYTGLPDDVIKKDLNYYHQVLDLMGKTELKYDDATGKLIGFNKESLNKGQIDLLNRVMELGSKYGVTYDLITKKMYRISDGVQVVFDKSGKLVKAVQDTNKEIEKDPSKNGQKQAVEETGKKAEEAKGKVDKLNQAVTHPPVPQGKLEDIYDETGKKVDETSAKVDKLNEKITHPPVPEGKYKQIYGETNTEIDKTKEKADGLNQAILNPSTNPSAPKVYGNIFNDLNINLGTTSDKVDKLNEKIAHPPVPEGKYRQIYDDAGTSADGAKQKVDNLNKSIDTFANKTVPEGKWRSIYGADDVDATQTKVDGLVETIKKATDATSLLSALNGVVNNTKSITSGLIGDLTTVASSMDNISNKAGSIDAINNAIKTMLGSLAVANGQLSGLFASVASEANGLLSPVNTAIGAIDTLTGRLVGLSILKIGGLPEFVHQLALLSNNLVLASQYAQGTVNSMSQLAGAMATVVQLVKSYNSALGSAGSTAGSIFGALASAIAQATSLMIAQYARNASALAQMVNSMKTSENKMLQDLDYATKIASAKVEDMGSKMRKEFKKSTDSIVDIASGLPARIGKAIRDNMHSASSAMDEVAKDMVKRFKSELGIHSPSKKFQELGYWTIKGLEKGLSGHDLKSLGKSVFDDFGGGMNLSWDSIKAYLTNDFSGITGGSASAWSSVATKALMMTGQYSDANLQRLLMQMQTESGGNAQAINLWDSNAQKGIPSKGLMQVIDPTFRAYAMKGYNSNIYDPLSNILASIRYAMARYGSLANAYKGHGYAVGGLIDKEELAMVGEGNKKEMIIPLEQHRNRALGLWSKAGQLLGIDPRLITWLQAQMAHKSSGGQTLAGGGSFGASSGEGGGESGGGDSGTSGFIKPSTTSILPTRTLEGGYDFTALELADPYSSNETSIQKQQTELSTRISEWQGTLDQLDKGSEKYRKTLQQILTLENQRKKLMTGELASTVTRNKQIQAELKKLPALNKQTEAQRNSYNKLMQEYDENTSRIQSLRTDLASMGNDLKQKSLEMYTDFINQIVTMYDDANKTIQSKIDDIDFQIQVSTTVNPDDMKTLLNLQGQKADQAKSQQATAYNKQNALQTQYNSAVKKYGANSDQAKAVKEQLEQAKKDYQDYTLAVINDEKDIKDTRAKIADDGISALKDYYKNMETMATDAIDKEKAELEKAHQDKMDMYDAEIDKINSVYDAKLKDLDQANAEEDYNSELADKNAKKAELVNKIALLSRDKTLEGKKNLADLQSQLADAQAEIDDFVKQHNRDLQKQALEDQKQTELDAVDASKTAEDTSYNQQVDALDAQKEAVAKQYEDLINNDQKWADMRNDAIKGNFTTIQTELQNMTNNLNQMNQGIFDNLFAGASGLSDEVKKQVEEANKLLVDNMSYNSGEVVNNVSEGASANKYIITDGKVNTSKAVKVSAPTKETTATTTTTPTTKTPTKNTTTPTKNTTPTKTTTTEKHGWKTTSALNLRSGTNTGNNVMMVMPKGAEVEYLGMVNGWAKIKYKGKTGYAGKQYLQQFKSGGYTGDWAGDEGKLAILHKKEQIFKEGDTKRIYDASVLLNKMKEYIPDVSKLNISDKLATAGTISNNVSYGDINITIQDGDKKSVPQLAKEVLKGMKKRGK